MSGPWKKYAASEPAGPWAKYQSQPAEPPQQAAPEQAQPGLVDRMSNNLEEMSNQPLTSYGAATEAGLANVAQGVLQAGRGVYNTFRGPQPGENAVQATPAYRIVTGAVDTVRQAGQVPAAVHDINQSPDPLGNYADVAARTAGHGAGQALTAIAAEGTGKAVGQAKKGVQAVRDLYKPLEDPKTVQPVLNEGVRDVLGKVTEEKGAPAPTSNSMREVVGQTADAVKAKSQPVFDKLDRLSNRELSNAQAAAKRYRNALDKAGKDAYAEAIAKQDKLFETYKDQFDEGTLKQAKADWAQYRALQEVDDAFNSPGVTSGQRPGIGVTKQPPEVINPRALLSKLNKLYHDGTLQTALGEDGAHQLMDHAGAAQMKLEDLVTRNKQVVKARATVDKAPVVGQVKRAVELGKTLSTGRPTR